MQTLFIRAADFTPASSWELARAIQRLGADEFSVSELFVGDRPPTFEWLRSPLAEYARLEAPREVLSYLERASPIQSVLLWTLNPQSINAVARIMSGGLFQYELDLHNGWIENPTFYRAGELVLGIVSHEGEGLLRLTESEIAQLRAAGVPLRTSGEWI